MKKKIAALLIVLVLTAGLAFAGGLLQLGVNGQLGFPMEKFTELDNLDFKDLFAVDNLYYGPELKLNLFFVDIDETLAMQYADGSFSMRNDLFADLYFKLLFLKMSAGVGLQTQIMSAGEVVKYDDFQNMMDRSFMAYRLGLGFCLGPVELSLQYMLPGKAPIGNRSEFFIPEPQRSTAALSILLDLI